MIPIAEVPKGVIPEDLAHLDLFDEKGELVHKAGDVIDIPIPRGYSPIWIIGALIAGTGLGAVGGYFFCRHRLETKYNDLAEAEISEMREHYRAKIVAVEGAATKPELEALVRDKGYTTEPPMAVTPPEQVVEAAEEAAEATEEPKTENVFEKEPPTKEEVGDPLDPDHGWDDHKERIRRSPLHPYVIHKDEMDELEDTYDSTMYTYYDEDDVLTNEREEVVPKDERDLLVGEANLNRFGHGSGDPNIVYIRNDRLELQMEITRAGSFTEEVQGFSTDILHSEDMSRMRHRRERILDDDE